MQMQDQNKDTKSQQKEYGAIQLNIEFENVIDEKYASDELLTKAILDILKRVDSITDEDFKGLSPQQKVKRFLDYQSDHNIPIICYAIERGKSAYVVEKLIDLGADPEISIHNELYTPAHYASFYNRLDVLDVLAKKKACIDFSDENGRTPLSHAAELGYVSMMNKLIGLGANINSSSSSGRTPLYISAESDKTSVAETLIGHNAKLNIPNKYGCIPINTAVRLSNTAVAKVILQGHVKQGTLDEALNTKDEFNNSILDYAQETKNTELIEFIESLRQTKQNTDTKDTKESIRKSVLSDAKEASAKDNLIKIKSTTPTLLRTKLMKKGKKPPKPHKISVRSMTRNVSNNMHIHM